MTDQEQEKLMISLHPYMAEAARIHEMNPKEYALKRPEDFHQNYKYVDNYYQSKHTWNSQKCKCCHREKKFDEFKMSDTNSDNIAIYVNCDSCIERHKKLSKESILMRTIMQVMSWLFHKGERDERFGTGKMG